MASKYSKIKRSVDEMKDFLDHHHEEYHSAAKYIRPSEGWHIKYYSDEVYQAMVNLHANLYEELYPKLTKASFATDDELINLFKALEKYFTEANTLFSRIISASEEKILDSVEVTVQELLVKAIYKLREVIKLAEEDLTDEHVESKKVAKADYVICIVTATDDEQDSVKRLLKEITVEKPTAPDSQIYYSGIFKRKEKRLNVVLSKTHHQGAASAAVLTTKMILRFQPELIVMLGHAAGNRNLSKSLHLGHILLCNEAVDYDQVSVYEKNEENKLLIKQKDRKVSVRPDSTLVSLIKQFGQQKKTLRLIRGAFKGNDAFQDLKCQEGKVISGNVLVRSEEWFDKVIKDNTGTIGLDMETYAFYYSAENTVFKNKPLFISLKAVSDFGSTKQLDEEKRIDQIARVSYATTTSARFFYEFALNHLPI